MDNLGIALFSLAANLGFVLLLYFLYRKWKKSINRRWVPESTISTIKYGDTPGCLTTVNFIGATFSGRFRPLVINGENTYVTYWCISIIVPLFPLVAYRVSDAGSNQYHIYGSEAGSVEERACLLLYSLFILECIVTVISLIAFLIG